MIVLFSLLAPAIAALIAIAAWATGVFRAAHVWLESHRRNPVTGLDPDGEDADWEI